MIELNGMMEQIIKELRLQISSIKGVKSLNETFSIEYVAEVVTDEEAESVLKVGAVLSAQAERYGFHIEVVPATTEELLKAKTLMAEYVANQTAFKA